MPDSIIIVYASRHGATEKCALELKQRIGSAVTLINLAQKRNPDIGPHDAVIIGGSIHIGKMNRRVERFIRRNAAGLLTRKLGLYMCHMAEGEEADKEFNQAYPESLRNHSIARGNFGGEFDFAHMSYLDRWMIRKAGVNESVSKINHEEVRRFASNFIDS
jgi:menaquinone-dependent protoporphyrinogen oxidase